MWRARLLELFEENLEHYPVLLPMPQDGASTRFPHLRLHNGAIWRWVRPLIGFDTVGQAHVRLEQRVLPSGPTALDMVANAALYYGLVHALARPPQAAAADLPFAVARANFYAAARHGLQAELTWLDGRRYSAREFVLQLGLPLARQGLRDFGLPEAEVERYLGVRRGSGAQRPDRGRLAIAAARAGGRRCAPHDGRLS